MSWQLELAGLDTADRFTLKVRWVATRDGDTVHVVAIVGATGHVLDLQTPDGVVPALDLDELVCRKTRNVVAIARAAADIRAWDTRRRRRSA